MREGREIYRERERVTKRKGGKEGKIGDRDRERGREGGRERDRIGREEGNVVTLNGHLPTPGCQMPNQPLQGVNTTG